ncbi:MAG: activator of HSP90 ATPase [Parvicellaceae bacterium]
MIKPFTLKTNFNVSAKQIYAAWLNSEEHSSMTGGEASASDTEGDSFTAWDRYIWGKNISLIPNEKMTFSWRTSNFNDEHEDSIVEIELKDTSSGCELSLSHSNIPEDGANYETGWEEHYFVPMREYFG